MYIKNILEHKTQNANIFGIIYWKEKETHILTFKTSDLL